MRGSTQQRLDEIDRGFKYFLYKILNETYGIPLAIAGIIASLYLGNSSINSGIITLYMIISVIFILTLFKSSFELYDVVRDLKDQKIIPKIIEGRRPYTNNPNAKALCLVEPSELYSYDTMVSFYHYKGNIEQLIGFGEVINIQPDKFIQIELNSLLDGNDEIVKRLIQNNAECLRRIRIKPFIPKGYSSRLN
jgi:hypothetical protein